MPEHNVEDHAKVYLTLEDGKWEIDSHSGDGYPLDGLEEGPQCVNTDDGDDHGRSCDAVNDTPMLPTLEELFDMLCDYYGYPRQHREPRIEIVHGRDPDEGCDHTVYLDGVKVSVAVYDVDPGRGYTRADWDTATDSECAVASPAVAAELRTLRDAAAEHSQYIED